MPASRRPRISAVPRPETWTLLLTMLIGGLAIFAGLAGCQVAGDSEPGGGIIAADSTRSPSIAGVHRYLFTVTRRAPATEVEKFFQSEVIPALGRDPRVGDITTFVDERNATYGVQLDLKTEDLPRLSLALDILSIGRTRDDARRLLERAATYFDPSSARQMVHRDDLSISRSILGTVEEEKR